MKSILNITLVILFCFASASYAYDEVPLPPPTGPGGGDPGTPQPPYTNPPNEKPSEPPSNPPVTQEPDPYPAQPNPGQLVPYTLGTAHTLRGETKTYTFTPRSDLAELHTIKITSTYKKTRIENVRIIFVGTGNSQYLSTMTGKLGEGQSKTGYINGPRVKQILVTATTGGFFKKESNFKVDATAIVRSKQ